MRELISRFRTHNSYTLKEIQRLAIAAVIVGFVMSFSRWGYVEFDAVVGLQNLLRFTVYAFLTLFAIDFGRKVYASHIGMRSETKIWNIGALFALVVAFISNGAGIVLFITGYVLQEHNQYGRKLKWFRLRDTAWIAFWGCIGGFVVGLIGALLLPGFPHLIDLIATNVFILIYTLVPLDLIFRIYDKKMPISQGTSLLLGSRTLGVFTIVFLVVGYVAVVLWPSVWMIVLAIILAAFGALYYFYENEL